MRIYISGHTGLVGSALAQELDKNPNHTWIGKTRQELDLLDLRAVKSFIFDEKPDVIILAAAKVGGIKANSEQPVDFLSENLQIQLNVINSAHQAGTKKLIFLGSSCIYPRTSMQPIKETELLTGLLEPTNEAYAIAKISGIKLVEAYRKQYHHNWISIMPTNIYGPRDNFDINSSHVIAALIRKFHDAKINSSNKVTLWGSGNPRREFLHAQDLADAILFLMENYNQSDLINVGFGTDISIFELANLVKKITNYTGEIDWDTSMPDGVYQKLLDSSRIKHLGWEPKISLLEGLTETYKWYISNLNTS